MRVASKVQAAQFAADVPPIIRDIQAAGHRSLNAIAGNVAALGAFRLIAVVSSYDFRFRAQT
jgi:hypothetical protein